MLDPVICIECGRKAAINNMSRHYRAAHPDVVYPSQAMHNQRFDHRVASGGADGNCLLWRGIVDNDGYGVFPAYNQNYRAHRWAYERAVGPIPEGMQLDHLCRNRLCVNVSHLEPVTIKENLYRGEGLAVANSLVEFCPQGHPYAGENLYVTASGARQCRTCRKARSKAWQQQNPERFRELHRRSVQRRRSASTRGREVA